MSIPLSLGSGGPAVGQLEIRLQQLGYYTGPADNLYGGGVESAIKAFQKSRGLNPDGITGEQTWAALFPNDPPAGNPLLDAPLAERCLALTGAFETSARFPDCYCGLAGDFDGQGISFGVVQWNIGQGTLQPLLSEMLAAHRDVATSLFHDNLDPLSRMLASPLPDQLAWTRSIQDPIRHNIFEPWKGLFAALGRTAEFQAIQTEHASALHDTALLLCRQFGVTSERALALMFDIRVQNGTIGAAVEEKIRADFAALPAGGDNEVAKLQSIANRRAEAANPAYVEDVRTRKLAITNGTGTVHGVTYDLEHQFGIRLQPFPA